MKKILIILVLGFLLLLGSKVGAQFATPPDSSTVVGWQFTTFTDVDDSLKAGYQIYQKIDTCDAVIDSAVGAERAAVAASVDEVASSVWAGRVSDETGTGAWVFGTSPTFTTDITSPLIIGGTATTADLSFKTTSGVGATGADMHFLVGNDGATEAMTILNNGNIGIGTATPDAHLHIKANIPGTVGSHPGGQIIIQNPADNVWSNAVITAYESDGSGDPDQQLWYLGSSSSSSSDIIFLNRRNSNLHLGTNDITRMTIHSGGNIGIGTLDPPERLSVVGNITVSGNAYHITSAETDSQFMSKKYIDDAAGGLSDQSVKGDHVDSTSEDFVFDDPYRVTSAEAESLLLTHGGAAATYVTATLTEEEVEDFVGGMLGGTETNIAVTYEDGSNDIDFVVDSEPWDSTTAWGNMINVHQDSIVSWANLVNDNRDSATTHSPLVNEAKDSLTSWANKVNTVFDWGDHSSQNYLDEDDLGNWKVFYSNGSGAFTELVLGGDGTYLKSNGAASAPTFATPPGGDPGSAIDDSITYGYQIYQKIDSTDAVIDSAVGAERADTTIAEFLHKEGGTMTGNIIMPDDAWIGVSADSVRMVFDTTEKDLIKVSNGKLRIIDNNACLELEDNSTNEGRIKVGNSQLAIEIDPSDLIVSSDIIFKIDGGEVARLHQSTNFGIGTLSPSERLSVEGNAIITGRITSGDTLTRSFVIANIDDTFDFPFWQTKRAITIVAVSAVCTGGTNVIGALQEYNATGTSVDAAVDGDWTITTSEYTDASFTNAGIDPGDWLGWKTTSVSGSVTFFSITFEYTEQ